MRCEYGVKASVVEKRNRERLMTANPVVVKGTWPYLSERRPLRGPHARVAMSIGRMRTPAVSGLSPSTSWKYRLRRSRTAPNAIAFRSWATTPPVNSRMRSVVLDVREHGEAPEREGEERVDGPRLPDAVRGERQAEQEGHDEPGEAHEPGPVDRRATVQLRDLPKSEVRPRRSEDPDRDVDVEERPPVQDRQDDAAHGETGHGAHPERDLVDAQRQTELMGRRRVHDHRGAVREEDRGAKALERSEPDHLRRIGGETRQQRAEREDREAARVQLHATDDVGDPADQQEGDRAPEDVRLRDPDRLFGVGSQAGRDAREADDHDARVEPRHEDAYGRHGEDRPLVLDPNRL